MPASKIQDEAELIRWFKEGRTYAWMVAEYQRKYGLTVRGSMFSNFRRRRGLDRRIARNDDLIPWHVAEEHRWSYAVMMLRAEARARAGLSVAEDMTHRLERWKKRLRQEGLVVAYDPTRGFEYVPRRSGDQDLIRTPTRKTSLRRNADSPR